MVWFHVDDNLAFDRRVIDAGNAAISLWFRAGTWATANHTGGFIPASTADELGPRSLCDRLVKVGLFEEKPGGYQFRDWGYQDSSAYDKAAADSSARASRRPRHTTDNSSRWLAAVPSIDPTKGTNR